MYMTEKQLRLKFKFWILENYGSQAKYARYLGVSPVLVSRWVTKSLPKSKAKMLGYEPVETKYRRIK